MNDLAPVTRLILPGWHGSGPEHWQRLWSAHDPEAVVVEQDNWDEPDLSAWLRRLDGYIRRHERAQLVAHSLGVFLVLHYAVLHASDARQLIHSALLVAPGDADLHAPDLPAIAGFAPVPRRRLPFPELWCSAAMTLSQETHPKSLICIGFFRRAAR